MIDFSVAADRDRFRHTASHIMAHAVKRLWPDTKLGIGPAIETGFYYDFDHGGTFSPEDFQRIEAEMKAIVDADLPVERFELPRDEAIRYMEERGETYKVELVRDLPDGVAISFYRQGDFADLCAGPHLDSTGPVRAFRLLQSAGAYWRGSEKNPMLQRIYGTAYPDAAGLATHLEALEEARRRDHNKLGRELGFFTTSDMIGQGLPILMPKGARVVKTLQRFVEDEEERRGYRQTMTPYLAKSDLYKVSGHWDHYRDGMFVIGDEEKDDEVFALRPMTCPFQFQYYLSRSRSYRDLPMRLSETSTLFRNESSGEMHGLIRVRQFTISEGHIACTPDQVEAEFRDCLDLAAYMLETLGLREDVRYQFSKWDPANRAKYIGEPEQWEQVQAQMKTILDRLGLEYEEADGEAAFYGPKLDIQIRNVFGKEDTLITVQIDFQLATRFGMEYTDKDGQKKHPIILHRTSIGCYERTLALLIEKYAGAFPAWLAPEQARLLPISERHLEAVGAMAATLRAAGFLVEVDDRDEKIGKKIREAQLEKVPYMLVVGDREAQSGQVSVRSRSAGDLGAMALADFMEKLGTEVRLRLREEGRP